MYNLSDINLSEEKIEESWTQFNLCESDRDHDWKTEPEDSVFFKRCTKCGGAEGIRFPEGVLF